MVHRFWASRPNNSVPFFAVFVRLALDKGLSTRPQVAKRPSAHVLKKAISSTTNCVDTWQGKKSSEFLLAFLEARLKPLQIPIEKRRCESEIFYPRPMGRFPFHSVASVHTYVHTCLHTYVHTYINTYIHTHINTYTNTNMHTSKQPGDGALRCAFS